MENKKLDYEALWKKLRADLNRSYSSLAELDSVGLSIGSDERWTVAHYMDRAETEAVKKLGTSTMAKAGSTKTVLGG